MSFKKEFESNLQHDPNVLEISFTQKEDEPCIKILSRDAKEAALLKGRLYAARGQHDMENPIKQNYAVKCEDNSETVKIFGNLFNAFNIIKEYRLISANFVKTILADVEVESFLDRTKSFILPENIIVDDESATLREMEDPTIEERYIDYLSKLDSSQLEKALNNFSTHLAEKGTNVVVKILPSQKHQHTSVK